MTDNYVCVIGQDGEMYEIYPTDGLVSFLQRLAEGEAAEQELMVGRGEYSLEPRSGDESCTDYHY